MKHLANNGTQGTIKPPRLRLGDTIGIVSPSWGGAGAYPHRVERGVKHLESLGFKVKIAPHALNQRGSVSDTAENRVSDLHEMFVAPDVRAIVGTIGGNHSCHLLPWLDFDLIRAHPTILMGFSDITVLNVAIWAKTGLVTFNGPMLLTDFAEYPQMLEYTERSFTTTLGRAEPPGIIEPSPWWTEEFLDWSLKNDLERARQLEPAEGPMWLRQGFAEGPLIGGCIDSLEHLRGTAFWPDLRNAILFLETSEEKPSPSDVDAMLMDYQNMGVLEQIRGLLFGRPMRYSPPEKHELHQVLLDRSSAYDFPVVAELDFGHTAPQFVLPIGCRARIDTTKESIEILEGGVS